jgi:alpha-glucosidase
MQWEPEPLGGFTTGDPWLPVVDAPERNVADQEGDPSSLLALYRELSALRPRLGRGLRFVEAAPGVLAYQRGDHMVALNLSDRPAEAPAVGPLVLGTDGAHDGMAPAVLAPRAGFVAQEGR